MLDERMHNYPEGYKEGPHCPYTKLVQITASLAGIELSPETFCTEELMNANYSDGAISWFRSGDFYPKTSCVRINRALTDQLKVVEDKIVNPSEEEAMKKANRAHSMATKSKIVDLYRTQKTRFEEKQKILSRWQGVIFETSVSSADGEKNVHFRQFQSPEELSTEEVIGKVKLFNSALNKITGYDPRYISDGTRNCTQSPKSHHEGAFED